MMHADDDTHTAPAARQVDASAAAAGMAAIDAIIENLGRIEHAIEVHLAVQEFWAKNWRHDA